MEHPLEMQYGPIDGWIILLLMGGLSISFFLYQVIKATRLVMLGAPDNRFDSWGLRIKEMLVGWLGQKRVLRDRVAGTMHVLMFWGFLMLGSDMLDLASANYFSENLLPSILKNPWNGMVELGYTTALIGAAAALIRRVAFTPEKLKGKSQLEGNFILVLILTITSTSFIIESPENPSSIWEPIGYWVSDSLDLSSSVIVASYWAHMFAICCFLVLIPVSKHMHLVMAIPNVFFHDTNALGTMRPLAVDDSGKAVPLEDLDIDSFGVKLISKHFVVFLFFFISGVCFYLILKKIIDNDDFCYLALLLYLLYPYLFGQSLFSPKDVPFMAIWVVCTYLSFNVFENLIENKGVSLKNLFILSLSTAFLLSIRVTGILILLQYIIMLYTMGLKVF